jgi:hypothetical protein
MSATTYLRRLAVFVCLAAMLLAVVTPGAAGLSLAAVFALCFVIAISVSALSPIVDEQSHKLQLIALPAFSSRPPPVR